MKCDDVEQLLPDYLSGYCQEEERNEIARHLNTCESCSALAREMKTPLDMKVGGLPNSASVASVLRSTRRKFITRIVAITVAVLAVVALLCLVTLALAGAVGYSRMPTSQRVLHDLIQFSQPNTVDGYANRLASGFSIPISVFTTQRTGLKVKASKEYCVQMSVFDGSFVSPIGFGADFVHPDVAGSIPNPPEASWAILERSGENTVATVNLSLERTLSLDEAAALVGQYDVELLWMAVEAGVEATSPKNMTGLEQWLQWGLPGTFRWFQGEVVELTPVTVEAYRNAILEELEWLDAHKYLVKPDRVMLQKHNLNTSVGGRAAYVLEHGIRVYGLQLTGPSTELVRLGRRLPVRRVDVVDIDFWFWR